MDIFGKYRKKYDEWYEQHRNAYLSELAVLKRTLPRKGKGLEIGVGTGRFASLLGIGAGVDPSRAMLNIARRRGVNVRLGYGERLPYRDEVFDYAAIIITLCFVKDPSAVLRETRRVLKKDGKVIVAIVDKDSFLGAYYRKKKSVFYKNARFFNVTEVKKLLAEAGFLRFSYMQTIFELPAEVKHKEKPKRGHGSGGFVVIRAKKRTCPHTAGRNVDRV